MLRRFCCPSPQEAEREEMTGKTQKRDEEEKKMNGRKIGYTTLLLDMDGTFLDFEAAEKSAFMTAMTRHGYPAGER